ncbi:SusC/RagA family TonB-linked outer membrane protein [Parapedobacter koreensis]|uniref:TonB-linked outer membrane protein, SusC/RagA family n=1 Tax=Parapedobacter koreensis TaxID=332977 RepID=A0A1H7PDQ8_9SPHI|nr:TonB-dependent receptor [Parapedobacter koreensis]SEL33769.1 TonB-linked outer membrane protein, SusC/RagA family [Parapedobacter koreensis]
MRKQLTNYLVVFCALIWVQQARAQITVTGRVIDSLTGEALGGATVSLLQSSLSTTTNETGNYSISVPVGNSTLAISYIGYQSTTVEVGNRTTVDVVLVKADAALDEVVVVGYGTTKEVNLTGSVSVVNNKDINWKQVGQTSMALQGVAPGVTITQGSGQPGNDAGTIRIRGLGTLGAAGQDPLVLVDGVEMGLNNIDPNDIETISVLKDAASAAIYGSRAANGVILVTTKRARSNKIAVNYNTYAGWQKPTNLPKLVSGLDHMLLLNEANQNVNQSPTFQESYIEAYRENAPSDLYPNTDWQTLTLTSSGFMHNHSLDISGGSDFIKVRASFNHLNQGGLIPNTGYRRSSLRVNTDLKASDKLGFKLDIRGNDAFVFEPGIAPAHIFFLMNGRIPANQEGLLSDGRYGQGWLGENPMAAANASGRSDERTYSAIINLQADWKPIDGMNINVMYSPEVSSGMNKLFRKTYQTFYGDGRLAYSYPAINSLTQTNPFNRQDNFRVLLDYARGVQQHNFKVLGGFELIDSYAESFNARRENFVLQDYPVLNAGSRENQQANGAGGTEYGLMSFFGRLNYDYAEKILFEANLRYDGSSRFAKGNRFGLFPSFSAGWRLSEEPFLQDVDIIDNLKVRASWGQLGNQNIGDYPFVSAVDLSQSYIFNESAVQAAALTQLGNNLISWETTEMLNVGLDATLFNKLSLTAEYYVRNTKDILLELPIPGAVGLGAPYQNAGKVRNKGWDISLNHFNTIGDFNYNVRLTLSDVKNEIVDLEGTGPYISGSTIRMEGYPIDAFFGYQSQGLFQTAEEVAAHAALSSGASAPGDIKYVDQNGDHVINADDRVVLGSNIPRYTYSADLTASFKGFDLNVFLQGVGKVEGYLQGSGVWAFDTGGTAYMHHLDRWTPENPNASYPRLTFGLTNNYQHSDYWMINGAYLRVKNIQLGYTLPQRILGNGFIKNFRITASGQNLLTFDNFLDGFDVEIPRGSIERYPIVKIYSFGLNVNF